MKTLPVEFRYRVIALTEDGLTSSEIAALLGVSAAWVRSIKALHTAGQSLEPKSRANKRRSLAEREGERIRAQIKIKPGTTLEDLKRDLNLSDTQIGLVSGFAFAVFYTTFGIPVAWLADRTNRVRVVAIARNQDITGAGRLAIIGCSTCTITVVVAVCVIIQESQTIIGSSVAIVINSIANL